MNARFSGLIMLVFAAGLGAALFITSENVQRTEKELDQIRDKLSYERDAMRVLNAEWTYLNRPDRLEQLARSYLKLEPGSAAKVMTSVESIPEPITPILPGVKPTFIPANFTAIPAPAPVAAAPKPTAPKNPPATTATFQQLINRVATNPNTP